MICRNGEIYCMRMSQVWEMLMQIVDSGTRLGFQLQTYVHLCQNFGHTDLPFQPSVFLPVRWGRDWDQLHGRFQGILHLDNVCAMLSVVSDASEESFSQLLIIYLFFTGSGEGSQPRQQAWQQRPGGGHGHGRLGAAVQVGSCARTAGVMLCPERRTFERKLQRVKKTPLGVWTRCSLPADHQPLCLPSPTLKAICAGRSRELGWCSLELIYVVYLLNTINHKLADSFVAIN